LLLIRGMLVFDRKDLTLNASYIYVSGGRLEIGTEADPFTNNAVITLHGDRWKDVEIPNLGSKVLAVTDGTYTSFVSHRAFVSVAVYIHKVSEFMSCARVVHHYRSAVCRFMDQGMLFQPSTKVCYVVDLLWSSRVGACRLCSIVLDHDLVLVTQRHLVALSWMCRLRRYPWQPSQVGVDKGCRNCAAWINNLGHS
jgi:hypothetical protein